MKAWRYSYGTMLICMVGYVLVESIRNLGTILSGAEKEAFTVLLYILPAQLGIMALFTVFERFVPSAGPKKSLAGYWLNVRVVLSENLAGVIFGSAVAVATTILEASVGSGWIDLRFTSGHGVKSIVMVALLSTFISDFFLYWLHRFQHESSVLWQQHKVHHMEAQLCAVFRNSWLESLLQGAIVGIPAAILFKLDPIQSALVGYVITAWIVFYHTNVRIYLGPMSVVVNFPQFHRIHHSRLHEHHDRNYSAFFPIWDILFGTYYHPKPGEFPSTGVHDEKDVEGFWQASLLPFREWWKMFLMRRKQRSLSALSR